LRRKRENTPPHCEHQRLVVLCRSTAARLNMSRRSAQSLMGGSGKGSMKRSGIRRSDRSLVTGERACLAEKTSDDMFAKRAAVKGRSGYRGRARGMALDGLPTLPRARDALFCGHSPGAAGAKASPSQWPFLDEMRCDVGKGDGCLVGGATNRGHRLVPNSVVGRGHDGGHHRDVGGVRAAANEDAVRVGLSFRHP